MICTTHSVQRAALMAAALLLSLPLGGNSGCATTGGGRDSDAPPDPGVIYQEGLDILAAGEDSGRTDFKKAYERFAEACRVGVEVNSPHVRACFNAGVSADRLGQASTAAGHYRQALSIDPGFEPAVRNLTVSLLTAGEPGEALPIYEEYLAKNPGDLEMKNNFAGVLGEAGLYDRGVGVIQELLFEDPKNTRAYKTLARIYFLQGSYRLSQVASANALKLDPDDPDIHNNIAITFLKEGKEDEAVVALKEALKLDEDNLEANMNLGLIAVRSADYELAAQCFQKVLKQFPGNAEAKIGMAVAYRGALEFDSALEQYESVLQDRPCHEMALQNKALVLFLFKQEYKLALKTYEAYGKCYPENDISEYTAKVQYEISEQERMEAELAELERQMAELEEKAKAKRIVLEQEINRGIRVFEKYAEVEQDPSWLEVFLMQVEGTRFAIESEDFFFMEEQSQYFDEFMLAYYNDALGVDPEEWMSRGEIVIEVPVEEGAEGEGAEAGAEGAEAAPAEGAEAAPAEGSEPAEGAEAAPAEGAEPAESAPAEESPEGSEGQ